MAEKKELKLPEKINREYVRKALALLTGRDKEIIETIHDNVVLTSRQLQMIHFPDVSHSNGAPVSRRMSKLRELGFTDVQRIPGDNRKFHVLGPSGVVYMSGLVKERTDSFRRKYLSRVRWDLHAGHRLAINDVLADLRCAEHAGKGELSYWESDGAFWFEFRWQGKGYKLFPDARGNWIYAETGELISFALEIDRATEFLSYVEAKISKYLLFLKSKAFAAYQGRPTFPVLLVITTGPGRARSLEQRVIAAILHAKLLPHDVARFLTVAVSDQNTLEGRSVLDAVWRPMPEGGPLRRFTELPPSEYVSRATVFPA